MTENRTLKAAGQDRTLNVSEDLTDIRDRIYEPTLLALKVTLSPPELPKNAILDQLSEGACTGFALAAVINLQNHRRRLEGADDVPEQVSPRMLYNMARLHDEWLGADYSGSSIRGAIKGFFHNGVCSEDDAPYAEGDDNWTLNVDQAKAARSTGLGAYYRLRPEILDYHAALNEVGSLIVSAHTHSGWSNPKDGIIHKTTLHQGGHAFAIVGYDAKGFLIQNSWGPDWGGFDGRPGIAHWSYQDWAENVIDAWVLRLSAPTPEAFNLTNKTLRKTKSASGEPSEAPNPRRQEILGHFIHIDDGQLVKTGRYANTMETVQQTADLLRSNVGNYYRHLMVYKHGGLNKAGASARRIAAMREIFMRNRIYPVHIMWETGFTEELTDVLRDRFKRGKERVGFGRDTLDWALEKFSKGIGRRLWREMKRDARRPFAAGCEGGAAIKLLLDENARADKPLDVHIVAHSAGSILGAELIKALPGMGYAAGTVKSCSLMAPACTNELYNSVYRPALGSGGVVQKLIQYNLPDHRELDDTVGPYGKSLLYLVSRAFEEEAETDLLGMEKGAEKLQDLPSNHTIWYAGRDRDRSDSKTHGGFDNDRATMNDILSNIMGKKPSRTDGFQEHELSGY